MYYRTRFPMYFLYGKSEPKEEESTLLSFKDVESFVQALLKVLISVHYNQSYLYLRNLKENLLKSCTDEKSYPLLTRPPTHTHTDTHSARSSI